MKSLGIVCALTVTALLSACAGSSHVAVRAANEAGYSNTRILSVTSSAPATFGCDTEDRVAYRVKATKPPRQITREFTVCCGPTRSACAVLD